MAAYQFVFLKIPVYYMGGKIFLAESKQRKYFPIRVKMHKKSLLRFFYFYCNVDVVKLLEHQKTKILLPLLNLTVL